MRKGKGLKSEMDAHNLWALKQKCTKNWHDSGNHCMRSRTLSEIIVCQPSTKLKALSCKEAVNMIPKSCHLFWAEAHVKSVETKTKKGYLCAYGLLSAIRSLHP